MKFFNDTPDTAQQIFIVRTGIDSAGDLSGNVFTGHRGVDVIETVQHLRRQPVQQVRISAYVIIKCGLVLPVPPVEAPRGPDPPGGALLDIVLKRGVAQN